MLASNPAENENVILRQLRWSNVNSISAVVSFSDNTAECYSSIVGVSGTTNISATFTLERKVNGSFTSVKSWTQTASSVLTFTESYAVTKGYTYRLSVSANILRNGNSEKVYVLSSEKNL